MFYLSYREYGLSKMVSSHLFYRVRWIIPERLGKLRVQKGEPCMKLDKQTYQQLLERKSPNSPLWRDCLLAFLIGGAICTVGEGVRQLWLSRGLDTEDTAAATAITMVFLGALLTCLHLYEKLAKYAGAGTIVPITGFANAIVSPAMEFKSEGFILGLGAKLFVIAGPVLVYGISASVIYGLILFLTGGGMIKRIGKRTLALENRPYLLGHAAAVGKKEGEGPLGERFDYVAKNDRMGQRSWELAESELQKTAIRLALRKATLPERSLDLILAGDLLNQCIGSFLASMHANVPYLGQYGACSTMAQGLALGGCLVESGAADRLLAAASSHFCSAERQYRFPLAYGGQRTPTAQWTATAAGAAVLGSEPVPNGAEPCDVRVTHVLFGKMVEMGVKDAANMGAAMAPEDVNLDPYIFRRAERCVLR